MASALHNGKYVSTISYQSPLRLCAKTALNGRTVGYRVSDGANLATVNSNGSVVRSASSTDSLGGGLVANLESLSFFDWKKQLSTDPGANMQRSTFRIVKGESWNNKKWTVLEETASKQGVFCRYFIDPATNLIWRTVSTIIGQDKPFSDCKLVEVKLNKPIPQDSFRVPDAQFIRLH
jgi:hypothetical protein